MLPIKNGKIFFWRELPSEVYHGASLSSQPLKTHIQLKQKEIIVFIYEQNNQKCYYPKNTAHQTSLFCTDLLQLAVVIPWTEFEEEFAQHYTPGVGRPAKPIRLMVGL